MNAVDYLKARKPPEGYEFTGEVRPVERGDIFLDAEGLVATAGSLSHKHIRRILRKLPEPPKGFVFTVFPTCKGSNILDVLFAGKTIGSISVRKGREEGEYGYCEAGPFDDSSLRFESRKFNTVLQAAIALLSSHENRRVPAS